ncbi:GIY-YIG nuclease family protein [Vibrio parahaemolyticus]
MMVWKFMVGKVFLTYGETENGEIHSIDECKSGKTALSCPFCGVGLIAVQGKIKTPHFRHDGLTCNESMNALPALPGWHHFHLDYKATTIDALHESYQPESKSPTVCDKPNKLRSVLNAIERSELINSEGWSGRDEFSEVALLILGALSTPKFAIWMRKTLQERIAERMADNHDHDPWFRLEANRQMNLFNSQLYLFEFKFDDGQIYHKVGRTNRELETRLNETTADLQYATGSKIISSKIINAIPNAGYLEKYVLYRYKAFRAPLKHLTEYLVLPKGTVSKLKGEFTRTSKGLEPFNKAERYIVTGRWRYEWKRQESIRQGMRHTVAHNLPRGRKVGTTESKETFLAKYPLVVDRLNDGWSLKQIQEFTGVGRSTIQRVRNALK